MYRAHLSEENHSFVRQMDSGSEEDIGDVELSEDDLEVDEFAETLDLNSLGAFVIITERPLGISLQISCSN